MGRPQNSKVLIVTACKEFFCCEQLRNQGLAADGEKSCENRWQRRSKIFNSEDAWRGGNMRPSNLASCNYRDPSLVTLLLSPVSLEAQVKGDHLFSVRHPSHLVIQCLTKEGPQKSTCCINEWNNRWMNHEGRNVWLRKVREIKSR